MKLAELLRYPEGKTIEYKRDLSSPENILKTLVAFANTAGGTVVIGVEDGDRRVRGIQDVLEAEEKLANLIADTIRPSLVPDIEVVPWRNMNLLVVRVFPSNTRPHYLQRLGPEAGVFIRVGSTNRRADTTQIEELKRIVRLDSFDEQPISEMNSEALDFRAASELFAPYRKLTASSFQTLRVTTTQNGRRVPTVGGLLLFGRNRFSHFPDAWIQAGRFAGTDRSRLIDSADIRVLLPRAPEEAIAFVQKHLMREAVIGSVRRTDKWSVPPVAIREAVLNAIVHADYSQRGAPVRVAVFDDRIEIDNPGLLPFGLTIDDIQQGVSKLRNRVIGRVFHELHLVEQWGSGIQRMAAACRSAGLDAPKLEEIGTHFRVTIHAVRTRVATTDAADRKILQALARAEELSTAAIAKRIGLSARSARSRLLSLISRGLVVEIGTGPNDPKRRYVLAEKAP